MNPEVVAVIRDNACASLMGEAEITAQVIAAIPEQAKDYRPEDRARSAFELAWHLASSEVQMLLETAEMRFTTGERFSDVPATVAGLVAWYKERLPGALAAVRAMSAAKLSTPVDFYGAFNLPAVSYLGFTEKHSIHHRGQLSTYLRPMGSRVPSIYGGSADQPWQGQ